MKEWKADQLQVKIYDSRREMGLTAAGECARKIRELLAKKETIHMIFAAAPSQNEFLESLVNDPEIDFSRIRAFHMDEYIGLKRDAPQGFGNFLKDRLFDKAGFRTVFYLNGQAADPEKECERYAELLRQYPCDIICMGIGENGHIAFNDPHVADFHDKKAVKVVALDRMCRRQQVNDGCFSALEQVPTHAYTLTVPTLMSARFAFCIVPAPTKANAVYQTVRGPVSEACPASILRHHSGAVLYLDADSASRL